VDYNSGSEHATGQFYYTPVWQKFLFDKGVVLKTNFAQKKLINQGWYGDSCVCYRDLRSMGKFNFYFQKTGLIIWGITTGFWSGFLIDFSFAINNSCLTSKLCKRIDWVRYWRTFHKNWRPEYKALLFFVKRRKMHFLRLVGKSKKCRNSKYNVGKPWCYFGKELRADSLRLLEMFLGPLEQSKPWNTAGITGPWFLKKSYWRLYHSRRWRSF